MSKRIEEQDRRTKDLGILEKQKLLTDKHARRVFKSELALKKQIQTENMNKREPGLEKEKTAVLHDRPFAKYVDNKKKENTNSQGEKTDKNKRGLSEKTRPKAEKRKDKNEQTDFDRKDSDAFFRHASELGKQVSSPTTERAAPALSRETINSLVESIYSCIQPDQDKAVAILLKGGILSGTKIKVSVKGNVVGVVFSSSNNGARKLLADTQSILKSRLTEKHISLGEFSIH